MYNIIICIVANFLRILIIRKFMEKIFDKKETDNRIATGVYTLFFIINTVLYLSFHQPLVNILSSIMGIFIITLLYTKRLRINFLITFLVYIVNMGCDCIAVLLFVDYESGKEFNQLYVIITVLLFLICELIIEKIITVKNKNDLKPQHNLLLLVIPVSSIILLNLLLFGHWQRDTILALESLGFLIINLIIFYLYNAMTEAYLQKYEKDILEQRISFYANQLDVMVQSESKIRSFQHDMKHHMNELNILVELENKEGIVEYLQCMKESIDNPKELAHSGNKDMDSILNYMLYKAKIELNQVNVNVKIPYNMHHSFDINIIIGNLLENAIEAAKKTEKKQLDVSIQLDRGVLLINIANSFIGDIIEINHKILTSKKNKEKHGIGLENVHKIVEKYNGIMEITQSEEMFYVNLLLYMTEIK